MDRYIQSQIMRYIISDGWKEQVIPWYSYDASDIEIEAAN